MTELILLKGKMPLLKKKNQKLNNLVFHIPESVKSRLGEIPVIEHVDTTEVFSAESTEVNVESPRIHIRPVLSLVADTEEVVQDLELEARSNDQSIKALETKLELAEENEEAEVKFEVPLSIIAEAIETNVEALTAPTELSDLVEVKIEEITPFFELKLENPEAVFNVGKSFLKDISEGKKHFGFTGFSKSLNEAHLLVYASFIQFSLKKPVLIITSDINHNSFSRFSKHFKTGALLNWKTSEWGDLCIVDQKQITSQTEKLSKNELQIISDEFAAVLWSLPNGNVQGGFQKAFMSILNILNSITFVVNKGQSKAKEIKESVDYYQCFNVPLKGVLFEEKMK